MQRKLVRQGNNALTVTLPAKWTKLHNLAAGSIVEIQENESKLQISSKQLRSTRSVDIKLDSRKEYSIRSIIASCYKEGYGIINLHFEKQISPKILHKVISSFTGLEIISHTKNSFEIRCFLNIEEGDCAQLLEKLFHTTQYIASLLKPDPQAADIDEINTLVELSVRKLRDHALRAIATMRFGAEKSYEYYDIVTVLEKIAASLRRLMKTLQETKDPEAQEVEKIQEHFSLLYKAYLSQKFKTASKAYLAQLELREQYFKELTKKTKRSGFLAHAYHISQLYVHLASRIMSLY